MPWHVAVSIASSIAASMMSAVTPLSAGHPNGRRAATTCVPSSSITVATRVLQCLLQRTRNEGLQLFEHDSVGWLQ